MKWVDLNTGLTSPPEWSNLKFYEGDFKLFDFRLIFNSMTGNMTKEVMNYGT